MFDDTDRSVTSCFVSKHEYKNRECVREASTVYARREAVRGFMNLFQIPREGLSSELCKDITMEG